MWLTRLAITRPVTILMLVLALVVLGLQSRSRLPVDLYPDIQFPMLFITTVYPGTGPEEVETLLTKPIEDAVSTVSGINKLSSTSSEGVSSIKMEFEIGTDLSEIAGDVRSKLDALRNSLPDDAEAPVVYKVDVGAMPVISLSLSSDRRSSMEVRRLADDVIKDRLSQLPGVASVGVSGGDVREIRVEVDKARLEAYGLSITQVVSALKSENLNLPSGSIEEERRTSSLRIMGEFTDPAEILNVRIANAAGNAELRVGDVAKVTDTIAKQTSYTRVDAAPSVTMVVQKQSDANTVKVVDDVKKELGRLTGKTYGEVTALDKLNAFLQGGKKAAARAEIPDDLQISVSFDQSTFIKDSLHDVYQSLVEGALLAVLIVFLFLHSSRSTFIVALAIPTSLISTFMVMDLMGFSVNMMSMLGLALCVGILVDDSIVVLENIHRHLKLGASPKEAAIKGRTEIGLAAMTITLVDVVVFVPIAFMGGIVGQFFRQFGIVVAAATLFSLLISFTLTPMLASRWLKAHDEEEAEENRQAENPGLYWRFTQWWETQYGRLDLLYRQLLVWALAHRTLVVCLGLMVMLSSFAMAMPRPSLAVLPLVLGIMAVGFGIVSLLWMAYRTNTAWVRLLLSIIASTLLAGAILMMVISGQANVILLVLLAGLLVATAFSSIFSTILLSLVFSIVLAVVGMKLVGTPQIFILMLLSMLGSTAYFLSMPAEKDKAVDRQLVTRPLAIMGVLLVVICVFYSPGKLGSEFVPQVDQRQFTVTVTEEVGTSIDVTDATTRAIEDALFNKKRFPETKTVFTTVGAAGGGRLAAGGSGADIAEISVELLDLEDVEMPGWQRKLTELHLMKQPFRSTKEVIRAINEDKRLQSMPGVEIKAAEEQGGPGGAPISIEVSGLNNVRTEQVAAEIETVVRNLKLNERSATYGTELSWRAGRPEVQAVIDRDRAAQYGISVAQIASALRTSLEGDTSTKYRESGKEYDIRIYLPESQRNLVSQIPSMVVGTTPSGTPVYLYEVVQLKAATGPTKVERTNRQRSVTVSSQIAEGITLGELQETLKGDIAKIDTSGVTINYSGQAAEMEESFGLLRNALLLSILMVFMLMSALFESMLSPLIIMCAVPQAMAGALFALTFTDKSLSIVTMIGIIMLVGLVTKNAILLVDFTNTLRKEQGMSRRDALLAAGPVRLRPILMTTLAMIFGMMPTALALAKGAEMRQPMAIAVIGGLMLSMFLTLLMVPVFYEIMDDLAARIGQLKDRLIHRAGL